MNRFIPSSSLEYMSAQANGQNTSNNAHGPQRETLTCIPMDDGTFTCVPTGNIVKVTLPRYPQARNQANSVGSIGCQRYGDFEPRTEFWSAVKQQIRPQVVYNQTRSQEYGCAQQRDAIRARMMALQCEMDGITDTMDGLAAKIERLPK